MFTSGLIPIVIDPILSKTDINSQELLTDIDKIEEQIKILGSENIHCIFSTTSCFAPRGYDK